MPQISTSQTSSYEREYRPLIDWQDNVTQLPIKNSLLYDVRPDLYWFSRSVANTLSMPANTLTEVDIPLSESSYPASYPKFYSTEVVPDAIFQNWQALANAKLSEKSYLFLFHLARKSWGWRGAGSHPLRSGSLANFLAFWSKAREESVEPDFVLTPNGNLQAEWYKDNSHFVELEFQSDHQILFGLFDGKSVIEGREKAAEVNAMLGIKDFRPLKWVCDN